MLTSGEDSQDQGCALWGSGLEAFGSLRQAERHQCGPPVNRSAVRRADDRMARAGDDVFLGLGRRGHPLAPGHQEAR